MLLFLFAGGRLWSQNPLDQAAKLADQGEWFDESFQQDSAAYYFKLAAEQFVLAEVWDSAVNLYGMAASRYQRIKDFDSSEAIFLLIKDILDTHIPTNYYYIAAYHSSSFSHYYNLGHTKKMKFHARMARETILTHTSESHIDLFQYHQLALISRVLGEYEEAIKYNQKILFLLEKKEDLHANRLHLMSRRDLFNIYSKKRDVQHMRWALEGQLELARKIKAQDFENDYYIGHALAYDFEGDFERALSYYRQSSPSSLKCSSMGATFAKLQQLDSAEHYFLAGLQLAKRSPDKFPLQISILIRLGRLYSQFSQKDPYTSKVLYYFQEAEQLMQQHAFLRYQSRLHYSWADYLFQQGQLEGATSHLKQSLKHFHLQKTEGKPFLASNYTLYGNIAFAHQEVDSALHWYRLAISHLSPFYQEDRPDRLPGFSQVSDPFYYVSALAGMTDVFHFQYQQSQEVSYLNQAWTTCLKRSQLIDSIQMLIKHSDSRNRWAEKAKQFYSQAIDICYQMYQQTQELRYIEQAYLLAEKSKNRRLQEHLQVTHALTFAELPDSILQREQSLQANLNFYREEYWELALKENSDSITLAYYQQQISQLTERYHQFQEHLESSFPEYFSLKYNLSPLSFSDLLQGLQSIPSCLIEYHQSEEAIYAIAMSSEHAAFHKIPWQEKQQEALESVLHSLHVSNSSLNDSAFFLTTHRLYQWLLSDVMPSFPSVKKLIIIPDEQLGYLPFEILNRELSTTNSAYLLNMLPIQYSHTASYMFREKPQSSTEKTFSGFAPEYTGQAQLLFNQTEVQHIHQLIGGQAYLADQATEQQFRISSAHSDVLHLAMHGYPNEANPMYSYLQFSPEHSEEEGKLYAYELYNMNIPASLVVLSACHTGYGPIAKGEGIQSLARAFAYAGCSSVVMSLWEADGSVANELMQHFYGYLAQDYPKTKALRQAKLDFLAAAPPHQQHPRHWANFVVMGDAGPLEAGGDSYLWWLGVIMVLVIGILSFLRLNGRR